jgi:protein gp37
MSTTIEWTDETWNPVRGCALVSAGCQNCYAMKQAHRFSGFHQPYEDLTELGPHGPRWTGDIKLVPEAIEQPLTWKKPRRVFVNSMSDLFHEDVPFDFIDKVFGVMGSEEAGHHTFQVLTKRPTRMKEYAERFTRKGVDFASLFPQVWLGVSVEDQKTADERIPLLLQTPAAVRFISAEPLLGPVDIDLYLPCCHNPKCTELPADLAINWVIVGGESGPGARPCDQVWIRHIKEQCEAAGVSVFIKQLGARSYDSAQALSQEECIDSMVARMHDHITDRKGGDWTEWPADLKVREYPR